MSRGSRRGIVFVLATLVVLVTVGSTAARAAKPVREPVTPSTTELAPGQGCAFNVAIEAQSGSRYTQTTFADGSFAVTGSGREKVRNLDAPGKSVTFNTSGRVWVAGDGVSLQASGRTIFYFYDGDVGPFGPVGADGALYYIVGGVKERFDENAFVTSFEWSGQATEICSLIE